MLSIVVASHSTAVSYGDILPPSLPPSPPLPVALKKERDTRLNRRTPSHAFARLRTPSHAFARRRHSQSCFRGWVALRKTVGCLCGVFGRLVTGVVR